MCGILGQINKTDYVNAYIFSQMLQTIHYRGPDGNGVYFDENSRLAFGHTRLAFLDLNKKHLNFYNFKTNSDTEVIIAAYHIWGLEFFNKLKDMFAIDIYDKKINKIFLING